MPSARNHNTLTIGGIGQGVETQHDVWRGIAYHVLDRIRIREADLSGGRVRLVADLEDAYPPAAGVVGFTRTLTWDGKATFAVADAVTLTSPKPVEWHLQSDTPVVAIGNGHRIGKPGEASLLVSFSSPAELSVTAAAATVRAPGPPGSIEKGPEEPRGYALRATSPATTSVRFEATLVVVPPQ